MTFTSDSHPARPGRRRRALAAIVALSLASGLAACGSDGSGSDAGSTGSGSNGSEGGSGATGDEGAFPVTIEHTYGSTEITERPERVVIVGLSEQDAFLALGVKPVATTEWFGEYDGNIWPWAQDAAAELDGDIVSLTDTDGIKSERIRSLRPDVIVGLYSGLTEDDYETLSSIAPTVAQPEGIPDFGISWQEQTLTAGKILGENEQAQELVDEVEAAFAAAAEEHPEFDGATAGVASTYEGIYLYSSQDPRGRFLTSLGFEVPSVFDEVAGDEFGGNLSLERGDELDLDVLVWLDAEDGDGDLGGPLYDGLAVHTEGREVFLDSEAEVPLGGATSFVTVLSLPYLIEGIVPLMATAIDGDPATEVPAP